MDPSCIADPQAALAAQVVRDNERDAMRGRDDEKRMEIDESQGFGLGSAKPARKPARKRRVSYIDDDVEMKHELPSGACKSSGEASSSSWSNSFKFADIDGDGRISPQEWKKYITHAVGRCQTGVTKLIQVDSYQEDVADNIFGLLDINNDGYLDLKEWSELDDGGEHLLHRITELMNWANRGMYTRENVEHWMKEIVQYHIDDEHCKDKLRSLTTSITWMFDVESALSPKYTVRSGYKQKVRVKEHCVAFTGNDFSDKYDLEKGTTGVIVEEQDNGDIVVELDDLDAKVFIRKEDLGKITLPTVRNRMCKSRVTRGRHPATGEHDMWLNSEGVEHLLRKIKTISIASGVWLDVFRNMLNWIAHLATMKKAKRCELLGIGRHLV